MRCYLWGGWWVRSIVPLGGGWPQGGFTHRGETVRVLFALRHHSPIPVSEQSCALQHQSDKLGFISFASHVCLCLGREDLGPSWTPFLNLGPCWAHCLCYDLPSSTKHPCPDGSITGMSWAWKIANAILMFGLDTKQEQR